MSRTLSEHAGSVARVMSVCVLVSLCSFDARGDWPRFRGDNGSGISDDPVPVEFGPGKNELWSVELQTGHSSPCVVGEVILLTTFDPEEKQLAVVCLSRLDGQERWRKVVPADEIEKGHPSFNPASSTPASDGERVVAYFGSYGLLCFDIHGELLWEVRMPVARSYAGNATSPLIVGDRVILYRGNYVDHFLLAVDKRTGEELWRVAQEEPFETELACTACPIVSGDQLIVHAARSVHAYNLKDGQRVWETKCATTATSTPVLAENEVIVAAWNKMGEPALRPRFPEFRELLVAHDQDQNEQISRSEFPRIMIFHRPDGAEAPENGASVRFEHADRDSNGAIEESEWSAHVQDLERFRAGYKTHGVLAIPLGGQGVIDTSLIRTLEQQGVPEVPSPLFYQGIVYFVKNGGVLTCVDLESGERLTRVRTRGTGTHYASPIIAGGRLYCTSGNGMISVLSVGATPEILAVNEMGDATYATPAADNGVLYVRTHHRLYAFGISAADQ